MTSKSNNKKRLLSDLMLLLTALLWGSGFSFRKMGLEYITPFFFNFLRFALGFLFILVVFFIYKKVTGIPIVKKDGFSIKQQILGGLVAGTVLAFSSALQQWGMLTTTAGKTGFITSLYTLFVPLICMLILKEKVSKKIWLCVVLAIVGLFCISGGLGGGFSIGDVAVLGAAFLIAVQMLVIGKYSGKSHPIFLSAVQMFAGGFWNLLLALLFESGNTLESVYSAGWPIFYSGIFAIGMAYTLQIIAQKNVKPSVAAILFSMESVFGALFGLLLLKEFMSVIQVVGCFMILSAVIIAQSNISVIRKKGKDEYSK